MKLHYLLIPLGIIAIAAVAVGVYQANSAPLPEGFPSPTPDRKIEVKSYPAYRAATYHYQGNLAEAANQAFYPLYQHISSNQISMTAPVETRYPSSTLETAGSLDPQGEASVSFLYRSTNIYPEAIANNIQIEDIPPMTVVSLGLQGGYSYGNYREGLVRLEDWLRQNPQYEVVGSPRRFFYDGPYIPDALKRSEIQIPIRPNSLK
ncbi:MAG: heme-binding protein [Microcystaceae cyanobacterium]